MGRLRRAASFTAQMAFVLILVRALGLIGVPVAMILIFAIQSAWKGLTRHRTPAEGKTAT